MLPTFKIIFERWKYNKDYELYVSNLGRVKTKDKELVKPKTATKGYMAVSFWKSGKKKNVFLHRLVLMTWKPCKNMKNLTIDHLDHNKRNNSVSNLEWVSEQENIQRAVKDKLVEKETFNLFCKEKFGGNKKILFKRGNKFVSFETMTEAINMVKIFIANVGDEENISYKIFNSIKNGQKVYGGYWSYV